MNEERREKLVKQVVDGVIDIIGIREVDHDPCLYTGGTIRRPKPYRFGENSVETIIPNRSENESDR